MFFWAKNNIVFFVFGATLRVALDHVFDDHGHETRGEDGLQAALLIDARPGWLKTTTHTLKSDRKSECAIIQQNFVANIHRA